MPNLDLEAKEILERFVPLSREQGDWAAVLRDADAERRAPRSWKFPAVAVAISAAALVAVAALDPWSHGGHDLADRALAAIGDRRVLHVVVRVRPQGTAIDLATGRRSRIYAEIEQWYEPRVGLRQRVRRSNGTIEPGPLPLVATPLPHYAAALRSFSTGYRDALRRNRVTVVRDGRLYGRPVEWVRFSAPEGAGSEVALDAKTYRPLYFAELLDGDVIPGSGVRVLKAETVAAVPASLARVTSRASSGVFGIDRTGRLSPVEANDYVGRSAFWLGSQRFDLALAWIGGLEYASGPGPTWSSVNKRWHGLELVYGEVDKFGLPVRTKPFIRIEEQVAGEGAPGQVAGGAPPARTLVSYGKTGLLTRGGLFIYIEASTAELVVEAAQELVPIGP